jgi:hypothetical protein
VGPPNLLTKMLGSPILDLDHHVPQLHRAIVFTPPNLDSIFL